MDGFFFFGGGGGQKGPRGNYDYHRRASSVTPRVRGWGFLVWSLQVFYGIGPTNPTAQSLGGGRLDFRLEGLQSEGLSCLEVVG